jgi:hypothetical protein
MQAQTSLRRPVLTSLAAALASAAGDALAPCGAADAGAFSATFPSEVSGIDPFESFVSPDFYKFQSITLLHYANTRLYDEEMKVSRKSDR